MAELAGNIDGTNKEFTTPSPYERGKISVFVNGLKEMYFTEINDTTILLEESPKNTGYIDKIQSIYIQKI